MRLVSNTHPPTHRERLAQLVAGADAVFLASPFLFDDFTTWVAETDLSAVHTLTLVTTLRPCGDDQLRKPAALLSLVDALRRTYPALQWRIQVDNALHGKVYLAREGGRFVRGLITSANLTHSGLSANHEWGLYTEDADLLAALHTQIDAAVEYPQITEDVLRDMLMRVEAYKGTKSNRPTLEAPRDLNVGLLYALERAPRRSSIAVAHAAVRSENIRYFLKPWGTKEEPVLPENQQSFDAEEAPLQFPRGREPDDIRTGDVVVTFGTGGGFALSVYRVLRSPELLSEERQAANPDDRRWPWMAAGQNLTPRLGASWWVNSVRVATLVDDYLAADSERLISRSGRTLKTFGYGTGHLRLDDHFGRHLVDQLLTIEQRIEASDAH